MISAFVFFLELFVSGLNNELLCCFMSVSSACFVTRLGGFLSASCGFVYSCFVFFHSTPPPPPKKKNNRHNKNTITKQKCKQKGQQIQLVQLCTQIVFLF